MDHFFLSFPYKIWGAQITGKVLPGVSQFSMHTHARRKASKHPRLPLEKKMKSWMCCLNSLFPVSTFFSEGESGGYRLQARSAAPEVVAYTSLIFFTGAPFWHHIPHGMQVQEPHKEHRSHDHSFHHPTAEANSPCFMCS